MKTICTIALVGAVLVQPISASPSSKTSYRVHHRIVNADRSVAYEVTTLTDLKGSRHENVFLIRAANGDRIKITRVNDFARGIDEYLFEDLATHHKLRSSWKMPVTAPDAKTMMAKVNELTKAGRSNEIVMSIEANGKAVEYRDTDLKDSTKKAKLRGNIKRNIDAPLFVKLEGMRRALALPIFFSTCRVLEAIGEGDACPQESGLAFGLTAPDCAFDESFGYVCSSEQQRVIKEAFKAGKNPKAY